jgi:nitrile hydratase accessory protein
MSGGSPVVLALEGVTAPPLRNGELDFEAPWQGRVFVMAQSLAEAGLFPWSDFQASLIRTIAASDAGTGRPYRYYDHFLDALLALLAQKGIVGEDEVRELAAEIGRHGPGHDHVHPHEH